MQTNQIDMLLAILKPIRSCRGGCQKLIFVRWTTVEIKAWNNKSEGQTEIPSIYRIPKKEACICSSSIYVNTRTLYLCT